MIIASQPGSPAAPLPTSNTFNAFPAQQSSINLYDSVLSSKQPNGLGDFLGSPLEEEKLKTLDLITQKLDYSLKKYGEKGEVPEEKYLENFNNLWEKHMGKELSSYEKSLEEWEELSQKYDEEYPPLKTTEDALTTTEPPTTTWKAPTTTEETLTTAGKAPTTTEETLTTTEKDLTTTEKPSADSTVLTWLPYPIAFLLVAVGSALFCIKKYFDKSPEEPADLDMNTYLGFLNSGATVDEDNTVEWLRLL